MSNFTKQAIKSTFLKMLEENQNEVRIPRDVVNYYTEDNSPQISFENESERQFIEKIKDIDVNTLTPIEALTMLYELHSEAEKI